MIPYGHQWLDDDDIAAVVAVLKSDRLTQGPAVAQFEEALADKVGARFAVAFSSGTAALHGACAAAELGAGQRVATSTLSFSASANCAGYVGAGVVLLDIDPHTLNIDPTSVPNDLDALVAVHYAGLPIDLAAIRDRPRVIIEDAAHAIGGATPDGPVGACVHSDMCCFSFHPVKTITTAEGGAVTTNDDRLADRLRRFRNHGMRPMPEVGGWYYEIDEVGFNYRLTDMQAALGTSQLSKLDRFVDRRNELAVRYAELLARSQVLLPPDTSPGYRHGRHLYPVRVEDRDRIFHELRDAGIGVQVHFVPIHRHPAYARLGFERADFPAAEEAYRTLLSLPLFPSLTQDEQDRVVAALHRCL